MEETLSLLGGNPDSSVNSLSMKNESNIPQFQAENIL